MRARAWREHTALADKADRDSHGAILAAMHDENSAPQREGGRFTG
ncbi:MAG TPA: hypothetical protein VK735_03595 [Pseudonocardia sp.]|nr:hypothetical protein [Pseudonocardia sp.]HTF46514.1 hypothetical protein [Pseudonocardia sp.]